VKPEHQAGREVRAEEKIVATSALGEHAKEICYCLRPSASPTFLSVLLQSMNRKEDDMQVLYARCCGLDVHQKTVVACVMITQANGKVNKSIRTFATTTGALMTLAEWLASLQVSHVAM
jgi:hypothetical protein